MKKFLMFLFVIGFSIFMFSCNTGTSGEKDGIKYEVKTDEETGEKFACVVGYSDKISLQANIIWGYEGLNK